MNQKKLSIGILVVLALIVVGVFVWKTKNVSQPEQITQMTEQPSKTDEIESIQDLIDGEYTFTPVDTSDWQTYHNEEAGFEVKIPKGWFCGGIALDQNSKRSLVCLEEEKKTDYYKGKSENNLIMINFPDLGKISTDSLRENLINAKKDNSKIYDLILDRKNSVLVVAPTRIINISDNSSEWNLVVFPSVRKDIFDGFLQSFRFLK